MRHMLKTVVPVLIAGSLAVPMISAAGLADDAADVAAIEQLWTDYQTYVAAGDGETWIGLYDPEGIQMPPGAPMRRYDEVAEDAKTWSPDDVDGMSIMPMETVILGDMAWSMGNYTLDFATSEGTGRVDGKFMTLLKRQDDGSWGIYRDIFNANN